MTLRAQSASAGVTRPAATPRFELHDVTRLGKDWSSGAGYGSAQPGLSPAQKLLWILGLATASWMALVVPIALIA
jgi:hypothetical protein